MVWIWLGFFVVVVVTLILLVYQWRGGLLGGVRRQKSLPDGERTVFNLRVGDIVQYAGTDWVVEGQLQYDDDGFIWLEYMLQADDRVRWLSVEEDDRLILGWLEAYPHLELPNPAQPPDRLVVDGVTYHQSESGQAKMTRIGNVLNRSAEACDYFDYEAADKQMLSIERWDGDLEVYRGQEIAVYELSLLPGDGRKVYGV